MIDVYVICDGSGFVRFYFVEGISLLIMFGFLISVWLACFGRILH